MNRMTVKDFVDRGYLQEVNRRVLHPLGLALEVTEETDGTCTLTGVWDCQDDPEGIAFGEVDPVKAASVIAEEESRRPARETALGYWIQPVSEKP